MKKYFLAAFFLLFIQNKINAQVLKVLDKTSLQPITGVVVKCNQRSEVSNIKGEVNITELLVCDSVSVKMVGYATQHFLFSDLKKRTQILLTPRSYDMDEVIISASRTEEKRKDVAQQVQLISARELANMNQSNMADVLTQSGNVLVQKSQMGGGSPIIRGFEANKVLIVVDGVRMNNAIFRGGHLQNVLSMDNSILEKTEIVFGPGSVVYGSDALGGVMHFYTKKPILADSSLKTFTSANAYVRTNTAAKEKTAHVDVNQGFRKIAFLTSITYSDFGDLRQGATRPASYGDWGKRNFYVERINEADSMVVNKDENLQVKSAYSQIDVLQKVLIQTKRSFNQVLNFQLSTTSDVPRYDRLSETNAAGVPLVSEWYYGPQTRAFASYQLNLSAANVLYDNARVTLAFQDIEESRHTRNYRSSNLNHRVENVKVYSANADFSKQLKKENELRYGLEGFYNTVTSTARRDKVPGGAVLPLDTRYPDGGSTMQTLAAYATHSWEISDKLILNDGLRYSNIALDSRFEDKTFYPFPYDDMKQRSSAITGNIGIIYMPGADWRFSLLGSSGFRAPNVDDATKVFESVAGRLIIPNNSLKPEYTYNGELNVSKIISKRVKVEATGFYTLYKNALTAGATTLNGSDSVMYNGRMSAIYTTLNKAEAFLYGANAAVFADISDNFTFTSTINYTYGRIVTDSIPYPLDHIPPVFGRAGLSYAVKKLKVELFSLFNGAKLSKDYNLGGEDNQVYSLDKVNGKTPAWYTLNLRSAYQFNNFVQLQFAVENVLDRYYRVFASGISAPGRNFVVTLRCRV